MASDGTAPGAVIVTGGSRGIGAAVALLAGARGYPIAVNYARDETAAHAVVAQIVAAGGRAAALAPSSTWEGAGSASDID